MSLSPPLAQSLPQQMSSKTSPHLGFGLGLRTEHYLPILATRPKGDWFKVLSEKYIVPGGKPLYFFDKIREKYPVVMHGVSLLLGLPLHLTKLI